MWAPVAVQSVSWEEVQQIGWLTQPVLKKIYITKCFTRPLSSPIE